MDNKEAHGEDRLTWEEPKIVELGIHETAGTGGFFGDNQSASFGTPQVS